ncbi:uncharacterized protein LOC122497693 [Leptopilina heterotoma]|uniref:uncharacterized protein LOC122497693 n=1 Tax=Leptopilina heterotoma TaxID=63436 RepID=UPI001CA95236|nr:uncharacterized protein LOC122497693 [Leptopilina heterotoma]
MNTANKFALLEFPKSSVNLKKFKFFKLKKCVEIVPLSWVFYTKKSQELRCKYPGEEDYSKVDMWVKEGIDPLETWKHFPANMIKEARDYDQAKRRYDRMCLDDAVESSSNTEFENHVEVQEKLEVLSPENAKSILHQIQGLKKNDDIQVSGIKKLIINFVPLINNIIIFNFIII